MPHDPQKYLYDMLDSCRFLIEFTHHRSQDDYAENRAFRSAVERELQIVGEAMLQLEKTSPATAARISEYRRIIGFRHVLVHGYDSLQAETVWAIVTSKLPVRLREVESLLREAEDEK